MRRSGWRPTGDCRCRRDENVHKPRKVRLRCRPVAGAVTVLPDTRRASLELTVKIVRRAIEMRELVLMSAMALLGAGCVEVIPHIQEFDAGPDITMIDVTGEPEVSVGKCMSGRRWTGGTMGSQLMNPGVPCMGPGCHSPTGKGALQMTLGGTIYGLGGERDDNDCNGIDGSGMAVAVWDEGMTMEVIPRLQVNGVGNFFTTRALPDTYKVEVIQQGRKAPMLAAINGKMNGGDCNYCHSAADFMGAKGRIVPARP